MKYEYYSKEILLDKQIGDGIWMSDKLVIFDIKQTSQDAIPLWWHLEVWNELTHSYFNYIIWLNNELF